MTRDEIEKLPTPEVVKFVNEYGLIGRHQVEYEYLAKSLERRLAAAMRELKRAEPWVSHGVGTWHETLYVLKQMEEENA